MTAAAKRHGEISVLRDAHGRTFLLYTMATARRPERAAPHPAPFLDGDRATRAAARLTYAAAALSALAVLVTALVRPLGP